MPARVCAGCCGVTRMGNWATVLPELKSWWGRETSPRDVTTWKAMGAVRWDNGPTLPWAWACSLMSGFRSLSLDFHGSVLGPGPVSRAPTLLARPRGITAQLLCPSQHFDQATSCQNEQAGLQGGREWPVRAEGPGSGGQSLVCLRHIES